MTRDLDCPLRDAQSIPGLLLIRVPDWYRRKDIESLIEDFSSWRDPVVEGTFTVEGRIVVLSPGQVRIRNMELEN